MYTNIRINYPFHIDKLYTIFLYNDYYLQKLIVDAYGILPTNRIYIHLTEPYNGYIISLSIDYESEDMYKISVYNIFTKISIEIHKDMLSVCQVIQDIKKNKVHSYLLK